MSTPRVFSVLKRSDGSPKGIAIVLPDSHGNLNDYRVFRVDSTQSIYPLLSQLPSYDGKSLRGTPKLTDVQSDQLVEFLSACDSVKNLNTSNILELIVASVDFHGVSIKDVNTIVLACLKHYAYLTNTIGLITYYFKHFKALNSLIYQLEHTLETFGINDIYDQNIDTGTYNLARTRVPQITFWVIERFYIFGVDNPRNVCYKQPVLYIYCVLQNTRSVRRGESIKSDIKYSTHLYPELLQKYVYKS